MLLILTLSISRDGSGAVIYRPYNVAAGSFDRGDKFICSK